MPLPEGALVRSGGASDYGRRFRNVYISVSDTQRIMSTTPFEQPKSPSDLVDLKLVEEALAGSRDAFNELCSRHYLSIRRLIQRTIAGVSDGTDEGLAAEAMLIAHKRLYAFERRGSFRAWLNAIAINLARDFLRGGGRRPPHVELTDVRAQAVADPTPNFVESSVEQEISQRLARNLKWFEREYSPLEVQWVHCFVNGSRDQKVRCAILANLDRLRAQWDSIASKCGHKNGETSRGSANQKVMRVLLASPEARAEAAHLIYLVKKQFAPRACDFEAFRFLNLIPAGRLKEILNYHDNPRRNRRAAGR